MSLGELNLYSYCANNPIMFTDPKGESVSFVLLCVLGTLVGVAFGALTAYVNNEDILMGAAVGGIIGLVSVGFQLPASVVALISAVGSMINDLYNYQDIYLDKAFVTGAFSFISNGISGNILKLIEDEAVNRIIGKFVVDETFGGVEFGVNLLGTKNLSLNQLFSKFFGLKVEDAR